jgi:hypothetical protein
VLACEAAALELALSPSPIPHEVPMSDHKAIFASRTVWTNVIGLAAVMLGLFGFETAGLDAGPLADAAVQLVAASSFIASTVFRIAATKRLAR